MSKDVPWFKHDSNAMSDPKIKALIHLHGMEGYGRWWTIVEYLRTQEGYELQLTKWTYRAFALAWDCPSDEAEAFLRELAGDEIELLQIDGSVAWSERLRTDMEAVAQAKRRYSDAGRKGGEAAASVRRSPGDAEASEQRSSSEAVATPQQRSSDATASLQHRSSNESYKKDKKEGEKNSERTRESPEAQPGAPPSASPVKNGVVSELLTIYRANAGSPESGSPVESPALHALVERDGKEAVLATYRAYQKAKPGKAFRFFLEDYPSFKAKGPPPRERSPTVRCPRCKGELHVGSTGEAHCVTCRQIGTKTGSTWSWETVGVLAEAR